MPNENQFDNTPPALIRCWEERIARYRRQAVNASRCHQFAEASALFGKADAIEVCLADLKEGV